MRAFRNATVLALVAITCFTWAGVASIDAAAARVVRHHRVVRHFVFASPQAAAAVSNTGVFASVFSTGILAPSTADPYERPSYGYDGHGYYGPGFAYPDY